jgi:CHAT domain-containing protein
MTVPVYSLAIALQLRQGRTRDALETAEQGRSRALLDLLASRDARASGSGTAAPVTRSDVVGSAAAAISRQSGAFTHAATVPELVATAQRLHSTLLLYWVSDTAVDAWTVAPDGTVTSAVTPMPRAKLDALIRSTTAFAAETGTGASLQTRGGQAIPIVAAAQPAWSELYNALIQPIARALPRTTGTRLTIIPHGPLMVVPFAALRDHAGKYLIERYAIQTAPTGGLFEFTKASSRSDARRGPALLISNPASLPKVSGEAPLAALPGAEAEVRAVARLLPGHTTVMSGMAATEPHVLDAIGHASIVHFATHAVVRDANPAASFLALGRPGDGSASGELTPDKIYTLSVPADLVVLSACRSGGGAPNGDGIAALTRAFFYAGASSVVASVWDVADAPATRLLPAFYRAWLGGADKASALRTAQLRLLADLRAGRVTISTALGDVVLPEDPSFWAGFVLIGEAD